MKWFRRLLLAVIFIVAAGAAVAVIHNQMKSQNPANSSPSNPAATPAAIGPASPSPPVATSGTGSQKDTLAEAVKSAGTALQTLAQAQFLSPDDTRSLLAVTIAPSKQQATISELVNAAPLVARGFGYQSVAEAQSNAQFYVNPLKYKVLSFRADKATIELYALQHVVPPDGYARWAPELTVVEMRYLRGRWLYNGYLHLKASQYPKPLYNLSYQDTVQRFQPYLRGFKDYESLR